MRTDSTSRRGLLAGISGVAAGVLVSSVGRATRREDEDDDVSPGEDLMREHAVLERIFLIYDEAARRLVAGEDIAPHVFTDAAGVVRSFIEDHHERDEERHVFPRLEKANRLITVVSRLRVQHDEGRRLTDTIVHLAATTDRRAENHQALAEAATSFVRMYRPHAAQENTVVFPEFRHVVTVDEYATFRANLEKEEHAMYGGDPFPMFLEKVAAIERQMGLEWTALFEGPNLRRGGFVSPT